MVSKFFIILLFFLCTSSISGQSWKYNDPAVNIGWKALEFKNKYLVSGTITDSSNFKQEPCLVVLNSSGEYLNTIHIPLFSLGLERGIFATIASINIDSIILAGWAYDILDSQAVFTTVILNQYLKVCQIKTKKIPFSNGIPSRSYSVGLNLYKDSVNHQFYASSTMCSTKKNDEGIPFLGSAILPCFHNFFLISLNGDITFQNTIPVNINNSPNGYLFNSSIDIKKAGSNSYLISSFGEGQAVLDDSFNIIKNVPKSLGDKSNELYSNNLIYWKNYFYSLGIVTYWKTIGNSKDYIDIKYNKILIHKMNKEGELIDTILLNPVLDKDSAGYTIFKDGVYFENYAVNLANAIVEGSQISGPNSLMFSYKNQTGSTFVINLDSNLKVVWSKEIILGYHNYYSLLATSDGGCILTGWGYAPNSTQELPLFAIKLDNKGQLSSLKSEMPNEINWRIFPNPFLSNITIENENTGCYEFHLFSVTGNELLDQIVCTRKQDIDLNNLTSGIYYYTIKTNGSKVKNGILVK
jgi:hypothetical protein